MTGAGIRLGVLGLALLASLPASAIDGASPPATDPAAAQPVVPVRTGRDIYRSFHDGLADPACEKDSSSPRWRRHFAAAPRRLVARDEDTLALFGYVVEALREASLPTEYALIPFVESGYKPGVRSRGGPAGMWQMIKVTARNHDVPIRSGYDGRLSPVDSTRAAVRYLKTLHGMFAGDWRLAVMAYNAGEYRVFGALRRSGQVARSADPEKLTSLAGITRAYVRKLHALSCLLDRADDDPQWLAALERPVPVLDPVVLPAGTRTLGDWARNNGRDPARVRRLNPAFQGGRVAAAAREHPVLVRRQVALGAESAEVASARAGGVIVPDDSGSATAPEGAQAEPTDHGREPEGDGDAVDARVHVVAPGDSAWSIAHRYGLRVSDLLERNGLTRQSVLQPGTTLQLPAEAGDRGAGK